MEGAVLYSEEGVAGVLRRLVVVVEEEEGMLMILAVPENLAVGPAGQQRSIAGSIERI